MMQEESHPASRRDNEKAPPSSREIRDLPASDRSHAADRPKIVPSSARRSGLLRELAESPGHLD
jgi:hypothetical protein